MPNRFQTQKWTHFQLCNVLDLVKFSFMKVPTGKSRKLVILSTFKEASKLYWKQNLIHPHCAVHSVPPQDC